MADEPRAKVFISCGQQEGPERETAETVGSILARLGFEPYIAVTEASLTGLKENIYRQLETSEYFLFVDFARERVEGIRDLTRPRRGSLFSHQELAVAAYLGLAWLPFQQAGVERNGIMTFIQANAIRFDEASELPALVERHVREQNWSPKWKNALQIVRDSAESHDLGTQFGAGIPPVPCRWFHASVRNHHERKVARGCVAYVTQVRTQTKSWVPSTLELAWAAFPEPVATIIPRSSRDLDLGFVLHERPDTFQFNHHSLSSRYNQPLNGPGEFEIEYVVLAESFPRIAATMRLTLGSTLPEVRLVQVVGDGGPL